MKTTSGAHVLFLGNRVIKFGFGAVGERINEQAKYLKELDSCTPQVYSTFPGGYVMERLRALSAMQPSERAELILNLLEAYIWKPVDTPTNLDVARHVVYVCDKAERYAYDASPILEQAAYVIPWRDLKARRIHGDPTFENTMQDGNGLGILCDPLPPARHVPAFAAVDVGKVLQSLYGYELIKANIPYDERKYDYARAAVRDRLADVEWQAAMFFCIGHWVRLMPYQEPHAQERLGNQLKRILDDTWSL